MAGILRRFFDKFKGANIDWDELEETLIKGDLGVKTSLDIVTTLRRKGGQVTADDVIEVTRQEILNHLPPTNPPIRPFPDRPYVILMIGVNGTGKTTSSAKLANWLLYNGHTVMLAAADTFRAAAIEQLEVWAGRLHIPLVKGPYKADPGSICYQAYQEAVANKVQFLICDTAGRLHTRHNLMEELRKIERVLGKQDETAPHECLLVVDATTGSNAVSQAREFQASVEHLTGLVITKLDGSGRGGVAVPIHRDLVIPPRFVGYGEALEHFHPFDRRWYVENLIRDEALAPTD